MISKLAIYPTAKHQFWPKQFYNMTQIDLITKADLQLFKQDLIREISALIKPHNHDPKQWLRSVEVRKLLHISPGTLQNFRVNGTLTYTKVGGIFFINTMTF